MSVVNDLRNAYGAALQSVATLEPQFVDQSPSGFTITISKDDPLTFTITVGANSIVLGYDATIALKERLKYWLE